MRIDRDERSLLVEWWFTVDRVLLAAVLMLMAFGIVVSLAASPAVAVSKDLSPFHFVKRQVAFVSLGLVLMLALSTQPPRMIRRLALIIFGICVVLMIYLIIAGEEINGAKRWVRLGGWSFQPSEIAKPAFAVLAAWAFAERERRDDVPAITVAVGIYVTFISLLAFQPDIGQSVLVTLVWVSLFVLAGYPLLWVGLLGAASVGGLMLAYMTLAHVRSRIDTFLFSGGDDFSQVERAYKSFSEGGFFGRGPGEGTIKNVLPDAHTDFIFAVIAEEYGAIACLALLSIFALIVFRSMIAAVSHRDVSARYAIIALALLIGFQALINMAVNVGLLPAKGMTLPMISAGGSSLIAVAVTFGMILALTRHGRASRNVRLPDIPIATSHVEGQRH